MDPIPEFSLKNKVGVVTGGSSGIGAATIHALSMHGAETVVLDIAPAKAMTERFIQTDITQPDEVEKAKDEVLRRYGRVDILANAAGVGGLSPLVEMTVEEWQRVIQVNLFGTFLCCRAFGRIMLAQGSGIIINVASNRGIHGMENSAHYAASKGGVIALTKSLAKELWPRGVRVYAINPGSTRTPLWTRVNTEDQKKQQLAIKGRVAEPEEIAGMIVLLTRPESACLNGLILSREPPR